MSWIVLSLVLAAAAPSSYALIEVGRGNEPVPDRNWPAGSVDLANLPTRVGWWEGPPFGGGQRCFQYRGDIAKLNDALAKFAQIRAPQLLVVVHDSAGSCIFLKDESNPKADISVDWEFTVWDPRSFHQLYNNPNSFFSGDRPDFRAELPAPRLDVYPSDRLDWSRAVVPAGIMVSDERATANGYTFQDGSVLRGVVYDMVTSKPVVGAAVTVERFDTVDGKADWRPATGCETNADGKFELKHIAGGNYRVLVRQPEHAARRVELMSLSDHAFKTFTVYLAPAVKADVTVLDASGQPVRDVTVRVGSAIGFDGRGYPLADETSAVTDAAGHTTFDALPQGYAQFFASAKGYQPTDLLKLYALPSPQPLRIHVAATGALRGHVKVPIGRSTSDINVEAIPDGGEVAGKWSGGTHIKPDGSFEFDNVTPGKYQVSADPRMRFGGGDPNAVTVVIESGKTAEVELPAPAPPQPVRRNSPRPKKENSPPATAPGEEPL